MAADNAWGRRRAISANDKDGQCPPGRPKGTVRPLGAANGVSVGAVHLPARPPEGHCAPLGGSERSERGGR